MTPRSEPITRQLIAGLLSVTLAVTPIAALAVMRKVGVALN